MLLRLWWLILLVDGRMGFSPIMAAHDPIRGRWRLSSFKKTGFEPDSINNYRNLIVTLGSRDSDSRCITVELHGSMLSGSVCAQEKRIDRIILKRPPSKTPHLKDMMRLLPKVIDISRKGLDISLTIIPEDTLRIDIIEPNDPTTLFFERADESSA